MPTQGHTEGRWTPQAAIQIIEELQRSGLTPARFAQQHGICVKRLYRWRDRLSITTTPPTSPPTVRLVELVPTPQNPPIQGRIRVCCPTGHVIELVDFDPTEALSLALRLTRVTSC